MTSASNPQEILAVVVTVCTLLPLAGCLSNNSSAHRGGTTLARTCLSIGLVSIIVATLVLEVALSLARILALQQPEDQIATGFAAFAWIVLGVQKHCGLSAILGMCFILVIYDLAKLYFISVAGAISINTRTWELLLVGSRLLVTVCNLGLGVRKILRKRTAARHKKLAMHSEGDDEGQSPSASEALLGHTATLSTSSDCESEWSGTEDEDGVPTTEITGLRNNGKWRAYFASFRLFLPLLVPKLWSKVTACFLVSIMCIIARRCLNILLPRQLGIIVDKLSRGTMPQQELLVYLAFSLLYDESGLGLLESLAKLPIQRFSYRKLANTAFRHVMTLSMDFHSDNDPAETMKAISQGEALTNVLETALLTILPTIVDTVVAFVFLYLKFDSTIALCMALSSASLFTIEVLSSSWNMDRRQRLTKAERWESRTIHQAIQGFQTVAIFNRVSHEQKRLAEAVDAKMEAKTSWLRVEAYVSALAEALVPCTLFLLASLIARKVHLGQASTGDLVFFFQYWDMLVFPIKILSHEYRYLIADLVDAERLLDLLMTKPTVVDSVGASALANVKGRVEFSLVCFAYDTPAQNTGLRDINILAEPGETIAVVGTTGAGKSTLMKLLLRFYDVSTGSIKIDGHDLRNVTLQSLREAIGVVSQAPLLFNTSIMENLRYARLSASNDEIYDACRSAAIHEQILAFPNGYNTTVGERGLKLSGGELQRLAIARVFLKDPRILVLDEATSAVDVMIESAIQSALQTIMESRTTFVIAHRLATVVNASRILVLHEGAVVEHGTHGELLVKDGRYAQMWARQTMSAHEYEALVDL